MAFMKTKQYESTPNILESEVGLVLKTYTADATNATAVNDKKIIKAGSVYPTNAAGAKGIVFEDVDMTDDAKRPSHFFTRFAPHMICTRFTLTGCCIIFVY